MDCEIWPQKLETSIYRVVHKIFQYFKPFRSASSVTSVTDGGTDGQNYDSNSVRLTSSDMT